MWIVWTISSTFWHWKYTKHGADLQSLLGLKYPSSCRGPHYHGRFGNRLLMLRHVDQKLRPTAYNYSCNTLGVVAEWSKVLTAVPWPFMVWSTLALGTYQLRFVSWVFHVIFSFIHFISLYTLGGLRAFWKPLPYNMYLFNLRIANHIVIKITITWF